jgi:hypothetical protein
MNRSTISKSLIDQRSASMKTIHLFLGLTLLLGTLQIHAQPQWRFHLAFEDATGAKDTLWFIYDTTATIGWDSHLGEGPSEHRTG